jgi:CPA1 family monovalent cation:H+ antiporter
VLATVVLGRFAYVFPVIYLTKLIRHRHGHGPALSWRIPAVISWAGLRGVVSMAAAFALPLTTTHGTAFPHRDLLLFITFMVVLVTLVVQGLTLPWVIRWLRLPRPDPIDDALQEAEAQEAAAASAIARLEKLVAEDEPPPGVAETLREAAGYRRLAAWERLGAERTGRGGFVTPSAAYRRLRQAMIQAEREEFVSRRDRGDLDDEILREVNRRLDLEEAALLRDGLGGDDEEPIRTVGDRQRRKRAQCPHLGGLPETVEPSTTEGCTDCLRTGQHWVHLRLCLSCGNVGCCDSSEGRHAEAHFHATKHPVIRSFEPGEAWRWCYVDEVLV